MAWEHGRLWLHPLPRGQRAGLPEQRQSSPPCRPEPPGRQPTRTVRRSSKLSASPSVTGGRTASPNRRKARSSAEPEPATLTTSMRKSGRTATTLASTRKTTSERSASGRTIRGQFAEHCGGRIVLQKATCLSSPSRQLRYMLPTLHG